MPAPPEPNIFLRERAPLAAAALPRKVREALQDLHALVEVEVVGRLEAALNELEQQLFERAERATTPTVQVKHLAQMRAVQRNRDRLGPRFLELLESEFADLRRPAAPGPAAARAARPEKWELRLLEEDELSEDAMLRAISMRTEARAGLPLQLLGQRYGVLAARPAFEPQQLPTGPHRLAMLLSRAAGVLEVEADVRMALIAIFDRRVLSEAERLLGAMNDTLARRNVLPDMRFVPLRPRPRMQNVDKPVGGGTAGWGEPTTPFDFTRQMLGRRRGLINRLRTGPTGSLEAEPVSTRELFEALAPLQPRPIAGIGPIRDAVRQQLGPERAQALSEEDADVVELVGLFTGQLARLLRADGPGPAWLERLQVALVRMALVDHRFFEFPRHPARELLEAIAQAAGQDSAADDLDPQLRAAIDRAVDLVVTTFEGDASVFDAAHRGIQVQVQAQVRRSEVAERRQVESARGKERLAQARQRAIATIDEAAYGRALPRVIRAIVGQAWADVLTLTLLRHDEDSEEWATQRRTTGDIADVAAGAPAPAGLEPRICEALTLIGYHPDEAALIARHLAAGRDHQDDDDSAASRTELAMRLKARARLGAENAVEPPPRAPRTPAEQARYEQLLATPVGGWFELPDESADTSGTVRRRLAWIGPATGLALFVNRRGQRAVDMPVDTLARLLESGEARPVGDNEPGRVDRAWQATLDALRGFASQEPAGTPPWADGAMNG